MKTLNETILENLIWLRENMIAKGKDVSKITEDIDRIKAIVGEQRKLNSNQWGKILCTQPD